MTTRRRVGGAAIGAAAGLVLIYGPARLSDWIRASYSPWSFIAADLLPLFAIAAGALCGLYVSRHSAASPSTATQNRAPNARRALATLLVVLYLITWIFGVPAVTTALMADAVREQQSLLAYRKQHNYERPQYSPTLVATHVAFAPLPGLVVVHAQTEHAGICDWCGWSFFLWWPGTAKRLGTRLHWIS